MSGKIFFNGLLHIFSIAKVLQQAQHKLFTQQMIVVEII
jgi:hypothetical protein